MERKASTTMTASILGLLGLSLAGFVTANHDIDCVSACLLTTFSEAFSIPYYMVRVDLSARSDQFVRRD